MAQNIQKGKHMTKNDIALRIARDLDLHQTDMKRAVQLVLDNIIEILVTERRLELRNFGVFAVKRRKPRRARNPRNGDQVMVPERNVITFKAGKFMEDRLNGRAASKEKEEGEEGKAQA